MTAPTTNSRTSSSGASPCSARRTTCSSRRAELDRVVLRQAREAIETRAAAARVPRTALGGAGRARGDAGARVHGHLPGRHAAEAASRCRKSPCRTSRSASTRRRRRLPRRPDEPAPRAVSRAATRRQRVASRRMAAARVRQRRRRRVAASRPKPSATPRHRQRARRWRAWRRRCGRRERAAGRHGFAPSAVSAPAAKAAEVPAWRRDSKTWLAEIERLRNAGDTRARDAELAEYKRQHRAYAVSPDR